MDAKKYLQQARKLEKMIRNKLIEIAQWKAIATGTVGQSDGERVQTSGSQDKMANAVCMYSDIEKEYNRCLAELRQSKDEIVHTIEQLPATEYDVLHKVYIGVVKKDKKGREYTEYLSLEDVAEIYDKTYSWATTVHGRAIKEVQKILDERKNRLEQIKKL